MPTNPRRTPATDSAAAVRLPAASHAYLDRAASSLREARAAPDAPARYAAAHVAALQAAAAVLAARPIEQSDAPARVRRSRNAWVKLAHVAPELAAAAGEFAAGSALHQAARAGSSRLISDAAAHEIGERATAFLDDVEAVLGLLPYRGEVDQGAVALDAQRAAG